MVILPPLDAHAKADLQRHRDAALSVLADYWDCFAKSYRQELGADDALPLTGVRFGTHARAEGAGGDARLPPDGTGAVGAGVGADSGGCGMLAACTLRFRVRSSFVALSGHDDTFESIAEICSTVRKGLYIDPKMVPVFEASEAPLNAYILDFYKHGQFDALDRYNGINGDEVYDKLRSFELTLKAIWAALKRRLEIRKGPAKGERVHFSSQLDDEKVVDALERIKNHFSELLQKRRS
ncbi:hypothetical protein T484DRAFT_2910991 [Baffinella frigidus]|nr:hypothetical protein T484DRAFT_2910991 [Cryptophyta sp. CCMP2293]